MKSLLINIKNLIPYLILISIYFFFVNLEARNDKHIYLNKNNNIEKRKEPKEYVPDPNEYSLRIEIPVIPYNP